MIDYLEQNASKLPEEAEIYFKHERYQPIHYFLRRDGKIKVCSDKESAPYSNLWEFARDEPEGLLSAVSVVSRILEKK